MMTVTIPIMKQKDKAAISRRKFMQAGGIMAAAAIVPAEIKAAAISPKETEAPTEVEVDYLHYIDPYIGNIAPLLNTNRPVVHWPNQMVRTFPRRQDYTDDQITGFPLLALNVITPQVIFSLKPSIGEITDASWASRLTYDHDLEITRPWYFSTMLIEENIRVEHSVGKKVGIYRFIFPAGVKKNI